MNIGDRIKLKSGATAEVIAWSGWDRTLKVKINGHEADNWISEDELLDRAQPESKQQAAAISAANLHYASFDPAFGPPEPFTPEAIDRARRAFLDRVSRDFFRQLFVVPSKPASEEPSR